MNYSKVLEIFDGIAVAKGKAKHPLIVEALKNPHFVRVIQYTLDTSKTFKVSKIKDMQDVSHPHDLFNFLDYLDGKKGATKKDKRILAEIASGSPEKFAIVNKILRGKTDSGFTNNTINKLAPGLIPYFPYMRCKTISHLKNIVFPCISQEKADGMYHEQKDGVFITRNGNDLDFSLVPDEHKLFVERVKFMGEVRILNEEGTEFMDRRDGNAVINKAQHSGLSQEEANRVRFVYWDQDSGMAHIRPYHLRKDTLIDLGAKIIDSRLVNNIEEAWEHYDEIRAKDGEGTILKNLDGPWRDGDSPDQIKLKAVKECELVVVGIVPGNDKYTGQIGSLMCESSCGGLVTDIGMGLKDHDRVKDDWEGVIISVDFNEVSKSKNKDTYALSHGRLVEPRGDKNEADTLEYIKNVKEVKR
jgi:hypothetical protein